MLDEPRYSALADYALCGLLKVIDAFDAEDVDTDRAGDVITMAFRSGRKCVINTQRPTRQLWLAHGTRAWHFAYDETQDRWLDDKGRGDELFATVERIVAEETGTV
jgi:CyaY protein